MEGSSGVAVPHSTAGARRLLRLRRWTGAHRAEIVLVALAIAIPELLTGSTPVLSLLNPLAVVGLLGFYGAGVLAIRETAIAWKKGWVGVLLLGLAYGIAEEGIATKTMLDPHAGAVGFLGVYGHFLGVNWVFAVVIALFHALYSIALPILIVDVVYPATHHRRFLGRTGVRNAAIVLGASVLVGYLLFDPHYATSPAILAGLLGAIALLVVAARWVPASWFLARSARPTRTPRAFLGLGIGIAFGWSFFYLFAPRLLPVPLLPILAEIGVALAGCLLAVRWAGWEGAEEQKIYFAAGLLSWYVLWDVLATLWGDYLVFGVLAAVYALLWATLRTHRARAQPRSPGSSGGAGGPPAEPPGRVAPALS